MTAWGCGAEGAAPGRSSEEGVLGTLRRGTACQGPLAGCVRGRAGFSVKAWAAWGWGRGSVRGSTQRRRRRRRRKVLGLVTKRVRGVPGSGHFCTPWGKPQSQEARACLPWEGEEPGGKVPEARGEGHWLEDIGVPRLQGLKYGGNQGQGSVSGQNSKGSPLFCHAVAVGVSGTEPMQVWN